MSRINPIARLLPQLGCAVLGLVLCTGAGAQTGVVVDSDVDSVADAGSVAPDARWKIWGGEAGIRFSRGLIENLAIEPVAHQGKRVEHRGRPALEFAVRDASALDFDVNNGNFAGFTGGSLALRGGYDLKTPHGTVPLRDARFVPRKGEPYVLDVIGSDGTVWLYADKMMYEVVGDGAPVLSIRTMDLRIAPALAKLLGNDLFAGNPIADVWMRLNIHSDKGDLSIFRAKGAPTGRWPGAPVSGVPGATYEADVFMHHFYGEYWRRETGTDGPGTGDGYVVFAPSSTLRNNRNNGTRVNTFPTLSPPAGGPFPPAPVLGDPGFETRLNASTALYTAHVAWYTKFSGNQPPYGNDQHPFLIWNLYRINADGDFEQIARSGVKHAWLTTNSPCDEGAPGSHVLARGCADTYGAGNNDEITDLGPRSEIIPAQGLWGRCGSVYDRDCNGSEDGGAPCQGLSGTSLTQCLDYDHRMKTLESDIEAANNVGATYLFESWYIVREDINIYNTMQNRPVTFNWTGSSWNMDDGLNAAIKQGPAIDRWVSPDTTAANERNTELVAGKAHTKVAVKVTDLGGGTFRYDYAVMNLDFARAVTEGSEPNLRVLSNDGFTAFSLPVSSALTVTDVEFSDGDNNPANDWTVGNEPNRITWTAPVGNRLNWGTMFRFSITANAEAIEAPAQLTTAQVSPVEVLEAASLVPQSTAVVTFGVGGEVTGLAAGETVTLRLNAGTALVLDDNGVFVFDNEVLDGGEYAVTIQTQPATQTCVLDNATGTIAGADVTDVLVTCVDLPPPAFSIGGAVSGLGGSRTVTLTLDGVETLTDVDDGAFVFTTLQAEGTAYTVTVSDVPADRVCSVEGGSGTIGDANVTDVAVVCEAALTYNIGGTVSGLAGTLGLQLNGGESIERSANGAFAFAGELQDGQSYVVAVTTQPAGQHCTVESGEGTVAGADVTDIAVVCSALSSHTVGGTLAGLPQGRSIALRLNGGPALVLSSSRTFTFSQTVLDGGAYAVTISSAPAGLDCTVANGTGTIDAADVDNVAVTCREPGQTMPFVDGFE